MNGTPIVHVLGCTNAGKSTLLELMGQRRGVHLVEVGKMMRAKYLDPSSPHYTPDKFKGQAAPKETAEEAWSLYVDGVREGLANDAQLILVDGQPRDLEQADMIVDAKENDEQGNRYEFLLVHADEEIREARLRSRFGIPQGFKDGDAIDHDLEQWEGYRLGRQRMTNDYRSNFLVLARLLSFGIAPQVLDTSIMPLGDEGREMMRGVVATVWNTFVDG